MIAPGTVIGDVDALFTTGAGGDQRAVGIEDGLVEEVGRLLAPEFEPSLIEDVLEGFDVVGGEAAAEVARGGGVGDAVGAQGVEEDEVVASLFDVVEAGAVAQGIVGEVEDVVGLVVGEVELEQVEPLVNGFREAEVADQQLNPADAAARNRGVLVATSYWMLFAVMTGSGEGAVIGRPSRRRILRLPAAWWWCGIGFTRNLLVGSVVGSV